MSAHREELIETIQSPPPEVLHEQELSFLAAYDAGSRPPGWKLTPKAAVIFIVGTKGEELKLPKGARADAGVPKALAIAEKFVGDRALVERAVVTLAGERGLLLVGEPGTAKSMLSELLAAAICGTSALTVQGTAGTTEDQLRYGWNYALLLAKGPQPEALVPSPVLTAMQTGAIARVEEVTRCLPEVQDALVSILSDRRLSVPELGDSGVQHARKGFNVIATANLRDKGVSEMSAALKRRFNFETVHPITDIREEMALVQRETDKLLARAGVPTTLTPDMTEVLVVAFHELRHAKEEGGKALEPLTTAMSTAEAIATGFTAGLHAYFYGGGPASVRHLAQHLAGTALKDSPDDIKRLRHYFNHVVKGKKGVLWQALYEARDELPEGKPG